MAKKFLFTISHATSSPLEAIVILKVASNMKAFDEEADIYVFLMGEGVQLARKGVADTISVELEGAMTNVGELIALSIEVGVKFFICHAFMPGVKLEDLVEGTQIQSSSYIGELLLDGYIPFSISI